MLHGGEPCGTPFVIDALRARRRLAWFALGPRQHGDPIAQANALAASLNAVAGGPLFGFGLPVRAQLDALRHHRDDLTPLWVVATLSAPAPAWLAELGALHDDGLRVLIDVRTPDVGEDLLPWATLRGPAQLVMRPVEADGIVPRAFDRDRVDELLLATAGRFGDLLREAARAAHLPLPKVPGPDGPLLAPEDVVAVDAGLAARALARAGDHVGALELAVLRTPELADELLRRAGPVYQEKGLLDRLNLLLSALGPPYRTRERVLEWRLVAAVGAGRLADVVDEVDAHLATFAAPELRARRAGSMGRAEGFALAKAAVEARRTPLTVWQFGRLHPDLARGAESLEESVRLAEEFGSPYDVARNAGALAARLLHLGAFLRARAWADWALQALDRHGINDGPRRLQLVNDLAYARVLTGDLAGLERVFADGAVVLDGALPDLAGHFRATWAAFELAVGRPEAAEARIRPAYEAAPLRTRSFHAVVLVRTLLELGREREALEVAEATVELAPQGDSYGRALAGLARGMARAVVAWRAGRVAGPDGAAAADDLTDALFERTLEAEHRLPAALHLLLVRPDLAASFPEDLGPALRGLSPTALRVFAGPPDVFEGVMDTVVGGGPALQFVFLGAVRARWHGRPIDLPPRMREVALALALHPDGIDRDVLNDFLTLDGQAPFSNGGLRGLTTRLRTLLPVSDAPYRFIEPYAADVLEARRHLAAGRVREAVALVRGPLLPDSDAPGVREARDALEEHLRQAALSAADADVLFELAERLGDDLEIWEATSDALPPGDPRLALAKARQRRLRVEFGAG